jgi:hypothetical protein
MTWLSTSPMARAELDILGIRHRQDHLGLDEVDRS